MKIGMLWLFDDFNAPLELNIRCAKLHYESTYGLEANIAYVNPSELKDETTIDNIRVKVSKNTQRHHVWIGNDTHNTIRN
jgi:hypothetical protein